MSGEVTGKWEGEDEGDRGVSVILTVTRAMGVLGIGFGVCGAEKGTQVRGGGVGAWMTLEEVVGEWSAKSCAAR